MTREIGRHRVSAARWILLVNPPRERPSASLLGLAADFLLFDRAPCVQLGTRNDLPGDIGRRIMPGTGGVLMGPDHPGVDSDSPLWTFMRIGVAAQLVEDPRPGAIP